MARQYAVDTLMSRTVDEALRALLQQLMLKHGGNVAQVALEAGANRSHVYRLLARFELLPMSSRRAAVLRGMRRVAQERHA